MNRFLLEAILKMRDGLKSRLMNKYNVHFFYHRCHYAHKNRLVFGHHSIFIPSAPFLRWLLVIIWTWSSLDSCTHSIIRNRQKELTRVDLTQKAIFEYLKKPPFLLFDIMGKGVIKLDPLICVRGMLSLNGKIYFNDTMRSGLIQYPLPTDSFRLKIPRSHIRQYNYTGKDEDYEHDYAIIHQFSPLLPTKEANIFFMEDYIWYNFCGEDKFCCRILYRRYLKFRIEDHKITYIDWVELSNGNDFIGFGCFPRKIMEEALPGEKIPTFIW